MRPRSILPLLGGIVSIIGALTLATACGHTTPASYRDTTPSSPRASETEVGGLQIDRVLSRCRERGDGYACMLAGMHYLGDTSSGDHRPERAAELLARGCRRDQPVACGLRASMHVTDRGLSRNLARAQILYRRACREGGSLGCIGLGRMYQHGVRVEADLEHARHLYRRACYLEDPRGCHWLGRLQLDRGFRRKGWIPLVRGCDMGHEDTCQTLRSEYDRDWTSSSARADLISRIETSCQSGELIACVMMGTRLETGRSIARDPERAAAIYHRACHPDPSSEREDRAEYDSVDAPPSYHPQGCWRLGTLYERGLGVSKQPERAVEAYRRACRVHSPEGCSRLGSVYERGFGLERNLTRAHELYLRSCARGHGRACYKIGSQLEKGRLAVGHSEASPEPDIVRSAMFYRLACMSRSAGACNALGLLIERRDELPSDLEQAASYYERSCQLGEPRGCYNLAIAHYRGEGVERDSTRAIEYFRRACREGVTSACAQLGRTNETTSTPEARLRTAMLFERACREGETRSCLQLAVMYRDGEGVERNLDRAIELFERLCRKGTPAGCTNLGYHYEQGLGLATQPERARAYFRQGCKGGDPEGCTYWASTYARGVGGRRDRARAAELFERACREGDAKGCRQLAYLRRRGQGGPRRLERARTLYERACREGDNRACLQGANWLMSTALETVEDRRALARQWLERACRRGTSKACRRLQSLDDPPTEPTDESSHTTE